MRAFLAAHLDNDLRGQAAALQNRLKLVLAGKSTGEIRVTWVRPEALHLTIKFLGDIEEEAPGPLRDAVAGIAAGKMSFAIPFARLGAFPRPQAPRAIWLGPSAQWEATAESQSLVALVRQIDDACGAAGVPREKHDWRPHLTLARIRDGERAAGRVLTESGVFERALALPVLGIRAISLMRSELLPEGPRHTEIWAVS